MELETWGAFMNSSRTAILALVGLIAILAADPALGETLRFALTGDSRSGFTDPGVNVQAVQVIGQQITGRGDIPFVLEGGDLQCGEDVPFTPTPPFPLPSTPSLAEQLESFKQAMALGGLKPAGTSGVGVPVYSIRGNHEVWDQRTRNDVNDWINAYGQYLPQNGPTTGERSYSEVGMTYSFKRGNSVFLGLDEYVNSEGEHGFFPIVNLPWIQQQIAARTPAEQQGYVFVFGHSPAYQIGEETILATQPEKRDAFLTALYGVTGPGGRGCRAYFCGHDHLNAFGRIMTPDGKPFYQIMIGGGGGPIENFDGVYSKDFPLDRGKVTDLYHDSDPDLSKNLPFHYSYAVVNEDGDSLWVSLYGSTSDALDQGSWPLLFTLVMNGSMTTTAAELAGSGVCNDSVLVFNQQVDGTCSGLMQGLGTLVKTGPGALVLTGANTYSGGTIIEQGLLSVNNTAGSGTGTGNVLVQPAGILGGSGTIGGEVVNRGTIAPGNSIGTLTISGNYIQAVGSTYAAEIDDQGHSDLIHATGIAALTGGTVNVAAQSGTYRPGMTYQILRADGGVSGTFNRVITNSPLYHGVLAYDSDDVFLLLMSYAGQARTQNQFALATYLDAIQPSATGDLSNVLAALDTQTGDQASAAFNQLAGEPYANLAAIDIAGANLFTDTAFYRLWTVDDLDDNCTHGRNLWAYGIGNWQRQQSTSSNAGWDTFSGYDNQIAGFMIGYDKQFDNVLLGFGGGYGRSDTTFSASPAQDQTDLFNFSGYGRADFGPLYVAGVAGYTHGWNDVTRYIQFGGLATRRATASVGGDLFGTLLQTGYNIDMGNFRFTPLAGLRYVHGSMGGTTETGADSVDLAVAGYGRNSLSSHFGGKLAFHLTRRWRAEVYGQWEHECADQHSSVAMAFTGDPSVSYVVRGVAPGRDGARTGLVTIGRINDRASVHVNYDALLQSSYASQQLTGGLSLGF